MKTIDKKPVSSGLILLHKQPGITSFDALRDIKRALGSGKVGHTGTLDKFAEGLLPVLTGRALKLSKWFSHCDKQYEGTVCFGAETDTLDPEGAVIAHAPLPSREAVVTALSLFRGEIEQAPPAYSAIHINGQRASALARQGEVPEMKKRPVTIYRLELLSWEPPCARIFVHCSSGTYIRSLVRDIAIAAGSRAYLTALMRTQVAGFKLEDAVKNEEEGSSACLQPMDRYVFNSIGIICVEISSEDAKKVAQGKPLSFILGNNPAISKISGNVAALFFQSMLVAVIEKTNPAIARWSYGFVYAHINP